MEWKAIDTMPRDVEIDTYGYWENKCNGNKVYIRNCGDFVSKTTVYPLKQTWFEYEGATGTYTRTHWMPLPESPKAE